MNIARTICTIRRHSIGQNFVRKFRLSSSNHDSSPVTQPQVQEEKYDFEDLKIYERVERRKPKIPPFMKDVFVSIFNRDLLAYPEIINKEDSETLYQRASLLEKIFSDPEKTIEDRRKALKMSKLYGAPVSVTNNGLAMNFTESLRYLEVISSDLELSQQISDHWVGLDALKRGLDAEQYQKIIDDLISGDRCIALCIKEKLAHRISQADFRTSAELDGYGIWRITGEKACKHANGYFIVLSTIEAGRLKAFLVHPGADGISHDDAYVSFMKTPGIPLGHVTEHALAHTLGVSRLHSATLCRCTLTRAVHAVNSFVHNRSFNGKSLAEFQTVRASFGELLLQIYAAESAEYFTAGLLDGYEEPDAELEMAMCRNFITRRGMPSLLKLLAIPALESTEQCAQLLDSMWGLTVGTESVDTVDTFIGLNGIHHAGKLMNEEIKQIRNPLFHPGFIMKKVFANRHQEKDNPKLTLYLAEHLHPSLRPPSESLEYCVLRMRYACETLMARHAVKISEAYAELGRLSEAATDILAMTAVLARASRAYCIGLRNSEVEMKLAACFVDQTKDRVRKLILEIEDGEFLNLDHFKLQFGKKMLDNNSLVVEKPTARVFW